MAMQNRDRIFYLTSTARISVMSKVDDGTFWMISHRFLGCFIAFVPKMDVFVFHCP